MTIKRKLMHYTWALAYGKFRESIINDGFKGINIKYVSNPFIDKWFADPFILADNDRTLQLLVEEFDRNVSRGRIARICIDKSSNTITECTIVLDLPHHLSFPAIYREGGEIYVHPECSASGVSKIYRYDASSDKLVDPITVVNRPLTDAVIREDEGIYKLFATEVPDPNGCVLEEFESESFWGPYRYSSMEEYPDNTARMAGMFIRNQGSIIRPSQDCCGDYGKAVVFYNEKTEICRICAPKWKFAGVHTFNSYGDTFVIDLKKYDFPLVYKAVRLLKP